MGGWIGFDSAEGRGSTFWFTVRLGRVAGSPVSVPVLPLVDPASGQTPRMLVVDEHPATCEGLVTLLVGLGLRAESAVSGRDAFDRLADPGVTVDPYLAVIADYQLPDMDGLSFAHEVHMRPGLERLKVLLMAPVGQRLDPGLLRTVGVAGALVRPVRRARLREVVGHLLRGEDLLATSEERTVALPSGGILASSPLRLLMAEDNRVNQKVALALLRKLGHTADIVPHGRAVLQAVQTTPYDAILMDCQMPELDGYETTRELRRLEAAGALGRHLPLYVIALTANAMSGDRERCLAAGMDDFLTKPLEESALQAALHRAVGRLGGGGAPSGSVASASKGESRVEMAAGVTLDPTLLNTFRSLRTPGSPDPVAELVDLFALDLPPRLEALRGAWSTGSLGDLKNAAHTLKGSASNVGGRRLAALCASVEQAVQGDGGNGVAELLSEIEAEAERLREALEREKLT